MNIDTKHQDKLFAQIKTCIDLAASDLHPNINTFTSECKSAHFAKTNFFADKLAMTLDKPRDAVFSALYQSQYLNKKVEQYILDVSSKVRVVRVK